MLPGVPIWFVVVQELLMPLSETFKGGLAVTPRM
jgi:hypothetical protein